MNDVKILGRPKKYPTAFELGIAVDLYFLSCDESGTPYTVEGLAYTLDVDRDTLLNYAKDEDDSERRYIVRQAKLRIQQNVMERGLSGKGDRVVTIFNLKNNFGYVDKVETESSVLINGVVGMKIVAE